MDEWKAKQAARASMAQALQAANPKLVATGPNESALTAAAKNMRIELKVAFPGIKFAVKSRRFSMGDAIDVSWVDGPVDSQVSEIVGKYSAGSFDGMTDCYDYEQSAWRDAFGDAKYVHTKRDDSDAAVLSAVRTLQTKYAGNFAKLPEFDLAAFRNGSYWNVSLFGGGGLECSLQGLINQTAARRTWALSKAPKVEAMAEVA